MSAEYDRQTRCDRRIVVGSKRSSERDGKVHVVTTSARSLHQLAVIYIQGRGFLAAGELNRISEPANMSSADENEHTAVELEDAHAHPSQPQVKKRRIQTVRCNALPFVVL